MKKQYKIGQHIYRIPPCPAYDISGMENWLSDLAEEGWFLMQDGFFAGIATFEYGEPRKVKYRLEAAQRRSGILSDNDNEPDPEQVELSKKYSWEYVAKRKDFYIYRSFDPSARELNTDPEVQALALNAVKKRQGSALFSSVFFLLIYPVLLTRGCLLLSTISMGTWRMVLVLLLAALMIVDEVRAFVHLRMIQKSLTHNGCYNPEPDWRKNAAPYFIRKIIKTMLTVFLVFAFLQNWGMSVTNEKKIPIDEYSGTVPFATIRDFAGEGSSEYTLTMKGLNMGFNTIEEKSDWVAPRCIEYNEHATIKTFDGKNIAGGLYIDYCELRNPQLAKVIAREFYRLDKMKGVELTDTPDLQADYVISYFDHLHFPTVVIQKDNIVVKAYFFQTSENYTMPIEEWAKMICDSLGNGKS
jgi:hypothetical protein